MFLGLTLGCARCHNHKFEPLTARDYYSMVAIFNGLERPRKGRTELDLPAGTWKEVEIASAVDRRIQDCERRIDEINTPIRKKLCHVPAHPKPSGNSPLTKPSSTSCATAARACSELII